MDVPLEVPETRYAKSGDVHIAYKVWGHGRFDLVQILGLDAATVDFLEFAQLPEEIRAAIERGRPLMRRIRFDKRGTGASD
ncbi:MAG TPA: hypothetical protein VIU81_02750, partial [Gaiellaceae bacterium]